MTDRKRKTMPGGWAIATNDDGSLDCCGFVIEERGESIRVERFDAFLFALVGDFQLDGDVDVPRARCALHDDFDRFTCELKAQLLVDRARTKEEAKR